MSVLDLSGTISMNLHALSQLFGAFIGYIGVAVILIGCLRALFFFMRKYISGEMLLADIRIDLGHYLALGLEFLVGKDIVESLVDPTWDKLGKLAVIIALRTLLTLFLEHEIKEVREELEQETAIARLKKGLLGMKKK